MSRNRKLQNKERLIPVTVKMPESLVREMDEEVEKTDSDRSKFARIAIRHRLKAGGAR